MSETTNTPTRSEPARGAEPERLSAFSKLYTVAARLLFPPGAEVHEAVCSGALFSGTVAAARELGSERLLAAAERLSAAYAEFPAEGPAELSAQFERTYGQAATKDRPMCELWYEPTSPFREEQELADLCGYYRAFNVQLSEKAKERPDHVGVEAEFIALLCYLAGWAAHQGREEEGEVAGSALRRFLRDHLGTFSAAFARRVADTAGPGLYREAAAFLSAVVEEQCEGLSIQRNERRFVELAMNNELDEAQGEASW